VRRIFAAVGLVAATVAFACAGTAAADPPLAVTSQQCEDGGGSVYPMGTRLALCLGGTYDGVSVMR